MMRIEVDSSGGLPVYERIVRGIKYAIARGEYRPGERLPSVRGLAVALLVNPNTVARAYRQLEREGIVVTRRGDGMFVADRAPLICRRTRKSQVADGIAQALREAVASGVAPAQIRAIVNRELRDAVRDARRDRSETIRHEQ